MPTFPSDSDIKALADDLHKLVDNLESTKHGELIYSALQAIAQISQTNAERLDWKILAGSLQDMRQAIAMFYPHRFNRKVSIFGSARTAQNAPEYQQAYEFAEKITKQGFMVITGALLPLYFAFVYCYMTDTSAFFLTKLGLLFFWNNTFIFEQHKKHRKHGY